jgi:hypothetical protein
MLFPKFPTGLEARDSGEYHFVKGQVRRRKKQVWIRGLNQDYNRDLKGLFKAAALRASALRFGTEAEHDSEGDKRSVRRNAAAAGSHWKPGCIRRG